MEKDICAFALSLKLVVVSTTCYGAGCDKRFARELYSVHVDYVAGKILPGSKVKSIRE